MDLSQRGRSNTVLGMVVGRWDGGRVAKTDRHLRECGAEFLSRSLSCSSQLCSHTVGLKERDRTMAASGGGGTHPEHTEPMH